LADRKQKMSEHIINTVIALFDRERLSLMQFPISFRQLQID